MVRVREAMTSDYEAVEPFATVIEVARRMRLSHSAVVAVSDEDRFYGLVSINDLIECLGASHFSASMRQVGSLTCNYPVISPDTDAVDAVRVMVNNHTRVLPVVKGKKLIGLLTLDSLARLSPALAAMVLVKTAADGSVGQWEECMS